MKRESLRSILACMLMVGLCWGSGLAAERRMTYDPDTRIMLNSGGTMVTLEKHALRFFDQDGKQTKSRELRGNEFAMMPEDGRVVGITRFYDNSPSTLAPAAFELIDLAGKRLYAIDKPKFSSVIVSPTGSAIVGIDGAEGLPQSTLRFYDERGKEVHAMTAEYFQGGRFSSSGNVFVFSTAKDGLLACSVTGQVITRYATGSVYDLSANGEVCAVAQDSTLRVYVNGKRQTTIHTGEPARTVVVSGDGMNVGWTGATHALVYPAGADSARVTLELSAPGENFRSLAVSDDGRYFAVGIDIDAGKEATPETRHTRGRAVVYDLAGQKIIERELAYQAWNARTPAVSFVSGGKILSIITREEVSFLELPIPVPSE